MTKTMTHDTFQLNVADVPIMKLLEALARGGFAVKTDAQGQMHVVEQPVPTDVAPQPVRARSTAVTIGSTEDFCSCGGASFKVMVPPIAAEGHTINLVPAMKCMRCGLVVRQHIAGLLEPAEASA